MGLLYSFFHPDNAIDAIFSLTIFFGLGIWLVVQRYKTIRDRAVLFYWPAPLEAKPEFESKVIDNPKLDSHLADPTLLPHMVVRDRRYITSFDPATGIHLKTFAADNETDIATKIETASLAAQSWAKSTFPERKRVIKSLKRWLVENQDACARVACRDTGKTFLDAAFGEILVTCAKLDWILSHGERVLRPEARHSSLIMSYKYAEVHFEPLGVVSAIVSWNYPLHNSWSPIIASLFSGNAIVLKCSEHVIWSTLWFVGAIKECLRACQFDPELVQVVCCWPEQADALTTSPLIKHITFIGSEEVGRKIAIAATKHLTPVTLELGGKDPAIILPGTDLQQWSSLWMRGIYQNAGQNCIGIERLIVHSSQYDELYDMICRRAKELRFGPVLAPPVDGYISAADCGSMISSERFENIKRILDKAERDGAVVDVGAKEYIHPYFKSGSYFSATVVGNPLPDSAVAQLELFAPVAVIQCYETAKEAIELANGTRYGLGASVFGPDQSSCIHIAKQLQCGMVSINDFGVFYAPPVKDSSCNLRAFIVKIYHSGAQKLAAMDDSETGPEGLRSLTNPKAIVSDRFPWLIQTSIPQVVDYPIRSMVQSWEFITGLTGFLYADGLRDRGRWLVKLVNASRSNPTR